MPQVPVRCPLGELDLRDPFGSLLEEDLDQLKFILLFGPGRSLIVAVSDFCTCPLFTYYPVSVVAKSPFDPSRSKSPERKNVLNL